MRIAFTRKGKIENFLQYLEDQKVFGVSHEIMPPKKEWFLTLSDEAPGRSMGRKSFVDELFFSVSDPKKKAGLGLVLGLYSIEYTLNSKRLAEVGSRCQSRLSSGYLNITWLEVTFIALVLSKFKQGNDLYAWALSHRLALERINPDMSDAFKLAQLALWEELM